MCVIITIGLALDYDVFLIGRVMEHRSAGYDVRAAIVKAVAEVGSTISAAGIIMALAFSGLLLANQTAVDQMGWILSAGVLADTFIVNTFLVPALMSLADGLSWWPTKMPMENLITLDHQEFTGVGSPPENEANNGIDNAISHSPNNNPDLVFEDYRDRDPFSRMLRP
eukprot:CAMPEP_0204859358 /NCGR_PEP_ID=MMETSP1347-20130617/23651_1 /ASSEMBLY_ACC=CAM_ASM_000690 /TAXON_ID=215587 /ORGANISM="Aplanochytrium stocchinoi, Strain GSBS06" /LENGTH=167 /DNA_ID=CAMNT_0052007821 /DNA_START=834 /DNA_END=1337 /DNA_ORIENTATION=-